MQGDGPLRPSGFGRALPRKSRATSTCEASRSSTEPGAICSTDASRRVNFVAEGVVMKALVEELRSEHFDHTRTIVRLVVALIVLAPVAAGHALMNAALK